MTWWEYAMWGGFGGFSVEAIQFYVSIKRHAKWPWKVKGEPKAGPLIASVLIRVSVSYGLTWAAAETGQISGPIGAIAVGVAAPLIVEQMARRVPIDVTPDLSKADSAEPAKPTVSTDSTTPAVSSGAEVQSTGKRKKSDNGKRVPKPRKRT